MPISNVKGLVHPLVIHSNGHVVLGVTGNHCIQLFRYKDVLACFFVLAYLSCKLNEKKPTLKKKKRLKDKKKIVSIVGYTPEGFG